MTITRDLARSWPIILLQRRLPRDEMILTALAAHNLTFHAAGGAAIVDAVSLDIRTGDRLAIIGPNGAGKTTLLKLMCGMSRPSSGSILLDGQPLQALKPIDRARQIAVVGQADQPDRRISVRDYVALGRIPHATRRTRAEEAELIDAAMERTGLSSLAKREMGLLSGGERQRAQIARALAQEPRILFLDEPTNHLDPRARGALLALVAELDLTVVAVLHDLNLVPDFATRVAVMRDGRLISADETLSRDLVREVFGIDLLRLPHPHENRELTVFDIPMTHH